MTIDDDGPGIPVPSGTGIERFVRLDEARSRDEGGSGLGLAIVDEVVRDHGGSMSIGQSRLAAHASSCPPVTLALFRLLSASWRQPCDMNITRIGI